MNNDAEKLISALTPEIDKKCEEIVQEKKEKKQMRFFRLLCIAALVIPTDFVFFGISLSTILIPVVFVAVAVLILSPILINQQGDGNYEEGRKFVR